ncbi:MAG: hypothetical protein IJ370_07720 [Oscillospiraceae bacterium]|nr:hypothetical protein [Oscillospiraceae bacterium]
MKVKDTVIGCIIETNNEFVIEQLKKYPERYKEIGKDKPKDKDNNEPAKN